MAIRVRVISKLHQGYHRAGQAIAPGESELVVSAEQCSALEGDPRLVVVRLAEDVAGAEPAPDAPQAAGDLDDAALGELSGEMATGTLAGVATADGKVTPLAEMKLDELRELAKDLKIPGAAGMKKADLVAAIANTEVQYPVGESTTEPATVTGEQ